jgi:hypothetical protein
MELPVRLRPVTKVLKPVVVFSTRDVHKGITMGAMSRFSHVTVASKKDSVFKRMQNMFSPTNIHVYPNPLAKGGTFELTAKVSVPGKYSLQLLDLNGRIIQSQILHAKNKEVMERISLAESVIPGSYTIVISDEGQKMVQSTRLIVL